MSQQIDILVERMRALEEEMEIELAKRAEDLRLRLNNGKIEYSKEILKAHRALRENLLRYVLHAHPLKLLTAPLIYGVVFPLLALDLAASVYQAVCFPIYGIPKVRRQDYFVFDRSQLAYLNLVEKINCAYCSYGTGLLAYVREIAGRTEQYWCPIKHAQRIKSAHSRYSRFIDYGDAEAYRKKLEKVQKDFQNGESS